MIKEITLLKEEQESYIEMNREEASKAQKKIKEKLEVRSSKKPQVGFSREPPKKSDMEVVEDKLEKVHKMMLNKQDFKYFYSKKRSVFYEWR